MPSGLITPTESPALLTPNERLREGNERQRRLTGFREIVLSLTTTELATCDDIVPVRQCLRRCGCGILHIQWRYQDRDSHSPRRNRFKRRNVVGRYFFADRFGSAQPADRCGTERQHQPMYQATGEMHGVAFRDCLVQALPATPTSIARPRTRVGAPWLFSSKTLW